MDEKTLRRLVANSLLTNTVVQVILSKNQESLIVPTANEEEINQAVEFVLAVRDAVEKKNSR